MDGEGGNPLLEEEKRRVIEEALELYGEEVKRLIYTYVKDFDVVDDLFQEVFVKVYFHLDSFRGESELKTWIYRIAINRSKDYLRSFKYRVLQLLQPVQSEDVESKVLLKERNDEVASYVFQLPIKYREIIILYYYRDLSVDEVATVLHISANTVKTRLVRGRERLRKMLEEGGTVDERTFRQG